MYHPPMQPPSPEELEQIIQDLRNQITKLETKVSTLDTTQNKINIALDTETIKLAVKHNELAQYIQRQLNELEDRITKLED